MPEHQESDDAQSVGSGVQAASTDGGATERESPESEWSPLLKRTMLSPWRRGKVHPDNASPGSGSGIIFSGLEGQWNQAPRDKRWDEDPFLGQPYGIGGQQASQDFVKNSRTKSWQRRFLLGVVVGSLFAVEAYILYLLLRPQSVVIDGEERPQTFQQRLSTPTVLWSGALMAYITAAVLSGIPVLLAWITKPDFSRVEDPEFLLLDKQHMRMDLLSRAHQSGLPASGTLESKIVIHIDKCAKVRVDIEFEVAKWEHRVRAQKDMTRMASCPREAVCAPTSIYASNGIAYCSELLFPVLTKMLWNCTCRPKGTRIPAPTSDAGS